MSPWSTHTRHGRRTARASLPDSVRVPTWFTTALNDRPVHNVIEVDDCAIHLRAWGDPHRPTLVLVHGGGAHSGWWDHIAPFFAATHHVVAPDLSGHGDSGRRPQYSLETWAREVHAAADFAHPSAAPTLIGHSMGGWVVAIATLQQAGTLGGIVVVDSPVRERAPESQQLSTRGHRTYASYEEIASRFRVIPAQDVTLPYVLAHVRSESVHRRDDRWVWKVDPNVFDLPDPAINRADPERLERTLEALSCRAAYIRCQYGSIPPEMAHRIQSAIQLRGPFIELPESGHHPMLDQPLALITALRTLLEVWSIT